MPTILAKAALALVTSAGSGSPTAQQQAFDLSKLNYIDHRIHQLDLQAQQLNSKLNQLQATYPNLSQPSLPELLPGPLPPNMQFSDKMPMINNVQPYGPSFQFNGLTVYIEPISAVTASPTTFSLGPRHIGYMGFSQEPIAVAPAVIHPANASVPKP
jgi:hypothetical protein